MSSVASAMAGLRLNMRGSAPVTSTDVHPAARRGLRLNVRASAHPTARSGLRLHGGARMEYHVDIPVEYFGHILGTNRWNARRIAGQCGHGTSIHGDLGEARFVVSSYCAEAAVRARDCIAQDYEHLLDRSKDLSDDEDHIGLGDARKCSRGVDRGWSRYAGNRNLLCKLLVPIPASVPCPASVTRGCRLRVRTAGTCGAAPGGT